MKIIEDTRDRLIVRDRSSFAAVVLFGIAAIVGGMGVLGLSAAETGTERLLSVVFAMVAALLIFGAPFIVRTHVHVFDRTTGTLNTQITKLVGQDQHQTQQLRDVIRAEIETNIDADGDTHRVVLIVTDAGKTKIFPLRNYKSSARHDRVVQSINTWLQQG